jgi:hypothetical protein
VAQRVFDWLRTVGGRNLEEQEGVDLFIAPLAGLVETRWSG